MQGLVAIKKMEILEVPQNATPLFAGILSKAPDQLVSSDGKYGCVRNRKWNLQGVRPEINQEHISVVCKSGHEFAE